MKREIYKMDGKTVWLITVGGEVMHYGEYAKAREFDFIGTMEQFDFFCEVEAENQSNLFEAIRKRHATKEEYEELLDDLKAY